MTGSNAVYDIRMIYIWTNNSLFTSWISHMGLALSKENLAHTFDSSHLDQLNISEPFSA